MITLYDSIEVNQIPAGAEAVAGYVGGHWPTFPTLQAQFPHAHQLSIAVNSSQDAMCLDIENGDASVADAPAWFRRQVARKVARPVFYTSLSNINMLLGTLEAAGITRDQYRLWSAHYTGRPHICGPSEGIHTAADATQWTDTALGRNLDQSLCENAFFNTTPAPPSSFVPADEARWEHEYDALNGRKGAWPALRRRVLARVMLHRQRRIVRLAEQTGWITMNRRARYGLLFTRTKRR